MSFYEEIEEIHEAKVKEDYERHHLRKLRGDDTYTFFCLWCNAFNHGEGQDDSKLFAKFLKEENITLTSYQRRYLAEKYFGFKFEYDEKNAKWISRMVNK